MLRTYTALGTVCACAFLSAVQSPTAHGAENANNSLIEEIVVTSRRRDESQQDVPLSVTAFGAESIERLQPVTLRDFDGLAPNLYVGASAAGPGASVLFIRGVGYADIEKTNTPQVGVIVDGIQIGSSTGQLIDVFDVESIEVNRGPQGVLFGKNTIGGNLVVNRVKPQAETLGFATSLEAGNFDMVNVKGRINVPLVQDTLSLKVGAIKRQRDGYWDNDTLDTNVGDIDFESQTVALRWQPNDSFDAILTYDRINDQSQTNPTDPRFDGDTRFVTLSDKAQPTLYEVDQVGLRFDWDLNDRLTLHNITGWHDSRDRVNQDFDAADRTTSTSVPFAQLHTLRDQDYTVFTQELRLDYAVNENLDIMGGIYYFDSELDFNQLTNNILQLPGFALGLPPGLSCAAAGLVANGTVGDAICQLPNARSEQIAGEDVESIAFFGSVNWRPTPALELMVGVRYLDEEKDAFNSYFDFSDGTFDTTPISQEFDFSGRTVNPGTAYSGSDSWDDTIFTASANWAFTDNSRVYVNYSEGFRSGGFSIRSARSAAEAVFDPEDAFQLEIGTKNDLFDGRLRANLALFHLEVDGSQFNSIIPLPPGSIPGTTTLVNNAGKEEIRGAELELQWAINNSLTLQVNGGILDVDNEEFSIACELLDGCVTDVPGVLDPEGTPRVIAQNDDSRQPEWNFSTNLSYGREWGPGFFTAMVQYKKVGEFQLVQTGGGAGQEIREGGYDDWSASVSYERTFENGNAFTMALWGKNLSDEEWLENALFLGGPTTGFQAWGAPRTYAFEIKWVHGGVAP